MRELQIDGDYTRWVGFRLRDMERSPAMWAITVEGFVAQLGVLIETLGFRHHEAYIPLKSGPGYKNLNDLITDSVARELIANFRKITGIEP